MEMERGNLDFGENLGVKMNFFPENCKTYEDDRAWLGIRVAKQRLHSWAIFWARLGQVGVAPCIEVLEMRNQITRACMYVMSKRCIFHDMNNV